MANTPPDNTPPGSYYVANSLAQAQNWASIVDAQQGYPRAGVEIGSGNAFIKDAGGGPFITKTYAEVIPHPTQSLWAFVSDSVTSAALNGQSLPAPTTLDSTWASAVPIKPMISRATLVTAIGVALATAGVIAAATMYSPSNANPNHQLDSGTVQVDSSE